MDQLYLTAQHYLHNHNVLSLATSDGASPWVSPVFYAIWSGRIVFLSAPHTRHCKNIAANANVSASIHEDYRDWSQIKGFQISGEVDQLLDAERTSAIKVYSEKFPVTGADAPTQIAAALDRISWYSLTVKQVYFIDNSKGLGHRDELDPGSLLGDVG